MIIFFERSKKIKDKNLCNSKILPQEEEFVRVVKSK